MMRLFSLRSTLTFGLLALAGMEAVAGDVGTLTGLVRRSDGQPAAFVTVALQSTSLGTTADEQGHYRLGRVPAGAYTLVVQGVGYLPQQQPIEVIAGQTTTVDVQVQTSTTSLGEVTVTGRNYTAYQRDATNIATRSETPLRDIPQSVQVLPEAVLRDQQVQLLQESIRNLAGITQFGGYNDFNMRGFRSTTGNFAFNGQRLGSSSYTPQPTYNLESVEAIKGPASVLYGFAAPGGIINQTTKLPQAETRREVRLTYGSYNQLRGVADATGPLTADNRWLYRVVAGAERTDHQMRDWKTRNFFLNPSLTFRPSDRSSLTLTTSYFHQNEDGGTWYNRGIMAVNGELGVLPREWSHHDSDDKGADRIVNAQFLGQHRFSDKLSLHLLTRYSYYNSLQQYHHINRRSYDPTTGSIGRHFRDFNDYSHDVFVNSYLTWKPTTGPVEHTVLAGLDYGNTQRRYTYAQSYDGVAGLNIFSPQYGNLDRGTYRGEGYNARFESPTAFVGAYVQDQLTLTPQLKAVLGLRYDTYRNSSLDQDRTEQVSDPAAPEVLTRDTSSVTAFVPRAGLVYQPLPELSLYGSYSQSFEPQYSNLPRSGGPFDPETGKQWEVGLRTELLGRRLVGSLAFYRIRKVNILTTDPTDPDGQRQIAGNEATSKGVEASLTGRVLPGLNLITNYAYNEARITKNGNPDQPYGSPWFENAPNHSGNLWAVYTVQKGALTGLGLGGGAYHVGKRYSFDSGFSIPAYTTFDAVVNYQYKTVSLALNAYNLADTRYYSGVFFRDIVWVGNGRSFRLTAGYSF
ncbi:TonB-dependent receptor [Hymenobacter metallicola]|uniref:TonB-dependent siderophore receptor n=1 Tax=Hymenobacter metallicola TaxID=2563114 RepID=A0A4Z0QJ55_9BACT|nr:TonB-dependent receptor [Hymenobacter metallicola]TGE29536.1 TonB-dependent siderophore receptor [Hymenobacter metallicola]